MAKHIVLIVVAAVGFIMSAILLWNCFWWPIATPLLLLLAQQGGILALLVGVVICLKKQWSWLVFCFLLGAALMAQINVVSWTYEHRAELHVQALTAKTTTSHHPHSTISHSLHRPSGLLFARACLVAPAHAEGHRQGSAASSGTTGCTE